MNIIKYALDNKLFNATEICKETKYSNSLLTQKNSDKYENVFYTEDEIKYLKSKINKLIAKKSNKICTLEIFSMSVEGMVMAIVYKLRKYENGIYVPKIIEPNLISVSIKYGNEIFYITVKETLVILTDTQNIQICSVNYNEIGVILNTLNTLNARINE